MTSDITPEERERIYQEEKARREEVDRIAAEREAQQKTANLRVRQERYDRERKRFKIAGIAIFAFFAFIAFLAIVSPKKPSGPSSASSAGAPTQPPAPPPAPEPADLEPGAHGYVNAEVIVVAPTKNAYEKALDAARIGDALGVIEGGAFIMNRGEHVLVLDRSGRFYKVRAMEGTNALKSGWTRKEFIRR
ncbi:MAG TPA: hypothetical protein VGS98_03300 [Thermoanaerobaculia bacterium]|jgi:hypothetical protein|nr:hypothetical protein [Thermoanaerobaculia bacterium]